MLGAIIKKPKLSDNLLNKPYAHAWQHICPQHGCARTATHTGVLPRRPFRFLHDIVSEVNRETSFCEGLYDAEEQNAASIKARSRTPASSSRMHSHRRVHSVNARSNTHALTGTELAPSCSDRETAE
jgi:hypothetical protein